MNNNRKRFFILTSIIILLIGISYLYFNCSTQERKAKKNVTNSLKIEIGMSKHEVIQIMGEPDDRIISYFNKVDTMYYYEPPLGASNGIYIHFDFSTDKVNRIVLWE